jgi:hypothetical protein
MENFKYDILDINSMENLMSNTEDHIDESTFLKEFFGSFGRDIGCPQQYFTNDPSQIIEYISHNDKNKLPSFMSTQPRRVFHQIVGIENIALDFDYYDKSFKTHIETDEGLREVIKIMNKKLANENKIKLSKKITNEIKNEAIERILSIRKNALEKEVKSFVKWLKEFPKDSPRNINPMVSRTHKGYHVRIYLDSIYGVSNDKDIIKETYRCLGNLLIDSYEANICKFEFLDENVRKDVYRIMRIPFSLHEVTGKRIELVRLSDNGEFIIDKPRGISIYKMSGLKEKEIKEAYNLAQEKLHKKSENLKRIIKLNEKYESEGRVFSHDIRPCFTNALNNGEMPNLMRLAFLMESWYAKKTPEEMLQLLSKLSDFKYDKSKYQIDYFIERGDFNKGYLPWSCDTIKSHNWCLENDSCPIWVRRYKDGEK